MQFVLIGDDYKICEDTITKTCLYNFDPLKPHFYIVKLGFTGVYIIFLILAQNYRLWVLGEAVLTSAHNLCFAQKYEKYQRFLFEIFKFLEVKIFFIFEKACFRNARKCHYHEAQPSRGTRRRKYENFLEIYNPHFS